MSSGAGAGGASSAYYLSKFAASASIPVNITVFERNSYIGGRSTTVNAYDDPTISVELGASIFVKVNRILNKAVEEFNLSTSSFIPETDVPGAALAVWNGNSFVFTQNGDSWWDTAKLLWKYGLAPIKTMRLMRSVVGKFLAMYEEPYFPFESLTQVAQDVGLLAVTAATGEQYLEESGITGSFGSDIVQASTRVNYAQNLNYIHGLEAMVCMAAENAVSVRGGNWQVFDRMIAAVNATTVLETAVTSIEKENHGSRVVRFESVNDADEQVSSLQSFDTVILAAPHQYANISIDDSAVAPNKIPYVELHVTLFTSPHLLSAKFFNMQVDEHPPRVILTTLPEGENSKDGAAGVGSPGFFSISLLDPVINPTTNAQEYLYKIFSPSPPNATFLTHLLGLNPSHDDDSEVEVDGRDISWMYRKVWNSYPYEYPRVTFEDIRLGDGLWYTSGMDSFISTMETNALAGKNVARLVIDEWKEKGGIGMEGGMRKLSLLPDISVV